LLCRALDFAESAANYFAFFSALQPFLVCAADVTALSNQSPKLNMLANRLIDFSALTNAAARTFVFINYCKLLHSWVSSQLAPANVFLKLLTNQFLRFRAPTVTKI
jgi:hypothetical protein